MSVCCVRGRPGCVGSRLQQRLRRGSAMPARDASLSPRGLMGHIVSQVPAHVLCHQDGPSGWEKAKACSRPAPVLVLSVPLVVQAEPRCLEALHLPALFPRRRRDHQRRGEKWRCPRPFWPRPSSSRGSRRRRSPRFHSTAAWWTGSRCWSSMPRPTARCVILGHRAVAGPFVVPCHARRGCGRAPACHRETSRWLLRGACGSGGPQLGGAPGGGGG